MPRSVPMYRRIFCSATQVRIDAFLVCNRSFRKCAYYHNVCVYSRSTVGVLYTQITPNLLKLLYLMCESSDSAFTSVARVFISLLVTFSYPLQCHPARRCILTIIAHYWPSGCSSVDNCTAVRSYYSHCSVCASTAGDSASVSTSAGVMTSSCCCGGSGAWNRQPLFTIEGSEHGSEAGDAAPNDGTPESLHEQRLFRVVTVRFVPFYFHNYYCLSTTVA